MIHSSKICELVQSLQDFSLKWVSEDGRIIDVPHCRCTSFHGNGDTLNIYIPVSNQVRTVIRDTIIEFNGEEVIL